MKLSKNFVKDYIDIDDVDIKTLAEDMTRVGNEYDSAEKLINATKLVVGEVIECVEHPDSDHLHVCKVNVGKEILQIVCGAKNVRSNLKVVVATIGSILPNGTFIKPGELLGHKSFGMLCSARELNIVNSNFNNIGIIELPDDAKIGLSFDDVFTKQSQF